jgi:hypothetical protein
VHLLQIRSIFGVGIYGLDRVYAVYVNGRSKPMYRPGYGGEFAYTVPYIQRIEVRRILYVRFGPTLIMSYA